MRRLLIALALVTLGAFSTCEGPRAAPPAPAKTMDGVLTNGAGMTLYTFDKDAAGSGKSVCNGPFGHALAGEIDRDELRRIARGVYQQLNP